MVGTTLWFAAVPLAFGLEALGRPYFPTTPHQHDTLGSGLLLACMVAQYLAFFWGGSHLAKAKGYSNGLLAYGILWPLQVLILAILLFALPDKLRSQPQRRSKHHPKESPIARIVRYRRNALVANVLGMTGMVLALAIFHTGIGIFQNRDHAQLTALLVFVARYAAIVNGCWWWVRAKHWNEAVVLIGLSPLLPLFIPYVRILFFRLLRETPAMLPLLMLTMTIMMIAVVTVLPDKSGLPGRKRSVRN